MSNPAVQLAQDPGHESTRPSGSLPAASRRSLRGILPQLPAGHAEEAVTLEGDVDRDITEVRLVDSVEQLHELGAGALVVLDRRLSHIADGYLMDVAVRHAVSRDIAGLVLTASDDVKVSVTARSMCSKSGLALVRLSPAQDLNTVLNVVAREIADTLHVTVGRVRQAVDAVNRIAGEGSTSSDLAALASRVLGYEVQVAAAPPEQCSAVLSVPVVVSQPDGEQFVAARLPDEDANTLLEGVLWRLASEGSRTLFVAEQAQRTNMLSVDEILSQLLGTSRETRDDLSLQARRLGIPIEGWHIVARVELDISQEGAAADLLPYEMRERLARVALATASASGGAWHTAQDPAALWLLHSRQSPPPRDWGLHVHRLMGSVVATLQRELPELRAYVGVGGAHSAAGGIAGSATEAKAAATHARSWRRVNHPISFDAVGIRSTIVEWYRSPTVQESITALFSPLDKVPQKRRNETIEFLGTYLDCGGSVARTAEAVHLHRNAVRTRLQRALALLRVDLEDADQRLFLQLACRAHRTLGVPHP